MTLEKDSPFFRLPPNLDPVQAHFFEGLALSAQMAHESYTRLAAALWKLTSQAVEGSEDQDLGSDLPPIFMDAWMVVDAINRFRALQHQMPNLKKRKSYKEFMRVTEPVEDLRNIIQHLNQNLQAMARSGDPAWGELKWFAYTDRSKKIGHSCHLAAGRFQNGAVTFLDPAGKQLRSRLDLVTLACKGVSASLSDGIAFIEQVVSGMEDFLRGQIGDEDRSLPRNLFAMAEIEIVDPE